MSIEQYIGDYRAFFADLLNRVKAAGIDVLGLPIVQLLYRTATNPEYEKLRDQLKEFCAKFSETQFNGRAVSILVLKTPLTLVDDFEVDVIELPAPRQAHMYPSGLESVGFFVGDKLDEYKREYSSVLTGVKEHGKWCQPAFITFETEKTAKFYDRTLLEIIALQGWKLSSVDE